MNNTKKKIIMLVILLIGCVVTNLISNSIGIQNEDKAFLQTFGQKEQQQKTEQTIRVYVSGAVLEPGLYDIPQGSRADAAILAAGGMTEAADATRVNLARKLKDGNQVNVPTLKQGRGQAAQQGAASSRAQAGVRAEAQAGSKAQMSAAKKNAKAQTAIDAKVRINSASVSELERLPGIGPALAQRIVDERGQARFTSVEDLRRVSGIGKAKLERLRAYVEVD